MDRNNGKAADGRNLRIGAVDIGEILLHQTDILLVVPRRTTPG